MEVGAFLVECRLLDCIPADPSWLQGLCDLVRARWERDTGWNPYLVADPADTTVKTRSQLVDLPSVLRSHGAVTLDGGTLTEDQDFVIYGRGECLKLLRSIRASTNSTLVIEDAVFGREADLPDDVRDALIALCAAEFSTRTAGAQGVVYDVRQGDVSYRSRETQAESMRRVYADAVMRHRRVVLR